MKDLSTRPASLPSSKLNMQLPNIKRNEAVEYRRFAAGVTFRVLGVVVSLVSAVITSRGLGVGGRGLLYTCTSAAQITGVLLAIGMPSAVVLVIAPRPELGRQAILRALGASIGAGLIALIVGQALRVGLPQLLPAPVLDLAPLVAGLVATQLLLWWCSALTQGLGAVDQIPLIELLYRSITVIWAWVALFYLKTAFTHFLIGLMAVDALFGSVWLVYIYLLAPASSTSVTWPREWTRWSLKAYGPYALCSGMRRVDVLLLTTLSGLRTTGLYSIAVQVLDLCQIAPVFLGQKAMFAFSAGHGDSPSIRWLRRLLPLLVTIVMIAAGLTAHIWIPLFFGKEFSAAGPIILALSLGGGALAWETVAVQEVNASGFPIRLTVAWATSFCTMVVLYVTVIPRFGVIGAAAALSLSYVVLSVFVHRLRARVRKNLSAVAMKRNEEKI